MEEKVKLEQFEENPMRKIQWLTLIVSIVLILSLVLTPMTASAAMSAYDEVKYYLSNYHVSGITEEQLTAPTIDGMIKQLNDPYTVYFTKEEADSFTSSINQSYVGIGVRINDSDKGVYVVEVFQGSPAEAAGIKAGDIFYSVNGVLSKGKKTDVLVTEVKGPEGTTVKVVMVRDGKQVTFNMIRKPIQIPVVTQHWFKDGKVGYLNISSFSSNLKEDVYKSLTQYEKSGMKSLVLDLRNNPGGYLNAAKDLAELFSEKGILIHTKDRNGLDDPIIYTNGRKVNYKIIVLVNENSASASEVFTGVVQDYKLGTTIGTKTFGKGSVQQLVDLSQSNGGMLKITVEEYLTPLQRKVNKTGLTPDIVVQGSIPQMLTALNQAMVNPIHLQFNEKTTLISGYTINEPVTTVSKNGTTYIPSRIAAALTGSALAWNATNGQLSLKSAAKNNVYTLAAKTALLDKGVTYVSLKALQATFAKLTFKINGKVVSVSYTKG
jgi:carboxyl-terminal processing protease